MAVEIGGQLQREPLIRSERPKKHLRVQEPRDHTYGSHSEPSWSKSSLIQIFPSSAPTGESDDRGPGSIATTLHPSHPKDRRSAANRLDPLEPPVAERAPVGRRRDNEASLRPVPAWCEKYPRQPGECDGTRGEYRA